MAVYELTMMSVKKYQMEVMIRVERALVKMIKKSKQFLITVYQNKLSKNKQASSRPFR